MSLGVGDHIGDYEVVQILGAGGMGKVYKARHLISHRVEAIKVLQPDLEGDRELGDRFLREIRVLATLSHLNIASLLTAQRLGEQLLMVMEYVDGITLQQLMAGGPIPCAQAIEISCQVLLALRYAHSRGVVHRDIKPSNIMLTPDGAVKLMDFGIAKVRAATSITQTGHMLGTLHYSSPEQLTGSAAVDERSDIYSLGVTLYEMVTGSRPITGQNEFALLMAIVQQAPRPPAELERSVWPELSGVILKTLEKQPTARFQTADALSAALVKARESQIAPRRASHAQPAAVKPAPPPPVKPPPATVAMSPPPRKAPKVGDRRLFYFAVMALGVVFLATASVAIYQLGPWKSAPQSNVATTEPPRVEPAPPAEVEKHLENLARQTVGRSVPTAPALGPTPAPAPTPASTLTQTPISSNPFTIPQPTGSAAVTVRLAPATDPQAAEEEEWNDIKESKRSDDYKSFMAAYPRSTHSAAAARRVSELDRWAVINRTPSAENVTKFVADYPDGVMKNTAQRLLDALRTATSTSLPETGVVLTTRVPTADVAAFERGGQLVASQRFDAALVQYTAAVQSKPDWAEARLERGKLYLKLGRNREAVADLSEAIRLKSGSAVAHNFRGYAYYNMNRQQEAVADFNEAIRLDANFAEAYRNRGNSLWQLGEKQAADADLKRAQTLGLRR